MDLDEFRTRLDEWLDANEDALRRDFQGSGTLDQEMAHLAKVKRLTYDAGWMRWGWPTSVGGLGGSSLLRAYLGEALQARDLVEASVYSMTEVLVPTLIDYAPVDLAADMVPRLLSGEEMWCQGFSEPGTGSNLASLTCRARPSDGGWRVSGQKVWTSFAHCSARCILLTRTGDAASAHRGITAFFVDMDSPGITSRTIETMHGRVEFCEVFFDDAFIPSERMLGEEGRGWSIAMDLLPYERSTALWHRAALLRRRLEDLLNEAEADRFNASEIGEIVEQLYAFRARSRATQHRLASGQTLGPETSVDKILLSTMEQGLLDLAAETLNDHLLLGDGPSDAKWREQFLYSRAATIYGGTAEIQRDIVARRLLDLGANR